MSSLSLPLFPLPTVVLFPNVYLPLHIFEPRYRQMVADTLAGDRLIGMTLLKPGYEADYEGRPPIYEVGCTGLITHAEKLEDGRYNLVLKGMDKFRILGEEDARTGQLYRSALTMALDDSLNATSAEALRQERRRLESLLEPLFENAPIESRLPKTLSDVDLVNTLAQYLEFEPMEKQALLERPDPLARCRAMVELLEMRTFSHGNGDSTTVH